MKAKKSTLDFVLGFISPQEVCRFAFYQKVELEMAQSSELARSSKSLLYCFKIVIVAPIA